MSIIKLPFIYRIRKSMADNTYCFSRGKNILKVKIDVNSSNTLKQQMQKVRMKESTRLCKMFNAAAHTGFPERPVDFTAWNAFTQANMGAISVDEAMNPVVDYEAVLVAHGGLEPVENVQAEKDAEGHTLSVSHLADDFGYGMNRDDQVFAVVAEQEKGRSRVYPLNERQDGDSVTVTVPASWGMDHLLLYVFALSADGRKASDSVFVPLV